MLFICVTISCRARRSLGVWATSKPTGRGLTEFDDCAIVELLLLLSAMLYSDSRTIASGDNAMEAKQKHSQGESQWRCYSYFLRLAGRVG